MPVKNLPCTAVAHLLFTTGVMAETEAHLVCLASSCGDGRNQACVCLKTRPRAGALSACCMLLQPMSANPTGLSTTTNSSYSTVYTEL
jgi:hypothetical protein